MGKIEKTIPSNGENDEMRIVSYARYRELGGIINEADYRKALIQASQTNHLRDCLIYQAEGMARFSGFALDNASGQIDEITLLYGVLRMDESPGAEFHHGQMCDQRLIAEVLRMLDRPELLTMVVKAYSNINIE